ncbi:hypothetical protein BT93_L1522 [Corymbia citriodora subsp. variegata]|uniref:CMP/dCMP-type deaminase domain-containing protein n=1 Tax=Corymbia citriodora subsp. variegata TaxID=360336 RepID=A0A8T0CMI6_CORYI|nr:hypothetical protein BT93_L1522 [Corymbia citriodora subsp. variegata]
MNTIRALKKLQRSFSACSLYVTCEPCIMCAAALWIIGTSIDHIEIKLTFCKICLFIND